MRTLIRFAKPILPALCLVLSAGWAAIDLSPDGTDNGQPTSYALRGDLTSVCPALTLRHARGARGFSSNDTPRVHHEFALLTTARAQDLRPERWVIYPAFYSNNHSASRCFSTRGPPIS